MGRRAAAHGIVVHIILRRLLHEREIVGREEAEVGRKNIPIESRSGKRPRCEWRGGTTGILAMVRGGTAEARR